MVLPAAVFARLHLASPARGLARGAAVSRDVVSLQALEPDLALAHSLSPHRADLAAADRAQPPETSAISRSTRARSRHECDGHRRERGRLTGARHNPRALLTPNCDLDRRPRGRAAR